MVRYLIENRIDSFEAVKQFNYLGYQYLKITDCGNICIYTKGDMI